MPRNAAIVRHTTSCESFALLVILRKDGQEMRQFYGGDESDRAPVAGGGEKMSYSRVPLPRLLALHELKTGQLCRKQLDYRTEWKIFKRCGCGFPSECAHLRAALREKFSSEIKKLWIISLAMTVQIQDSRPSGTEEGR